MANHKELVYYSNFLKQQTERNITWNSIKTLYLDEVSQSQAASRACDSEEELHSHIMGREVVRKILAAELFLDRTPPVIISATSELELHEHLRERNPSQEPRLFGEIVYSINNGPTFFMLDKFFLDGVGGRTPEILAEAGKAAEFLLGQGYVPVDAMFTILPLPEKK